MKNTTVSLDEETKRRLEIHSRNLGLSMSFILKAMTYEKLLLEGAPLNRNALDTIGRYHKAVADSLGGVLNPEIIRLTAEMVTTRNSLENGQIDFSTYITEMRDLVRKLDLTPIQTPYKEKEDN